MSQADEKTTSTARGVATAVIVLGLLIAGLFLTSHILHPTSNKSEFHAYDPASTGAVAEPEDSLDVLFVGDSVPFFAVEPLRIWESRGITSHILFVLGAHMPELKTLLCTVKPYQHPKLIIFETNALFKPFTFDEVLMDEMERTFPVLRYHSYWRWTSPSNFNLTPTRDWLDPSKGYRPEFKVKPVEEEQLEEYDENTKGATEITPFCQLYLEHLIDYSRSMGATPVFISLPSVTNWSMPRHEFIDTWAREHDIDYIDLNVEPTKVSLDWETDTKDAGDHLNTSGAEKVSYYLADLLAERYSLPDHRGDADYAAWDEAYASYFNQ